MLMHTSPQMDSNEKVLVLFTCEYPYGIVAETFLETEIQYLCRGFDKVIVIPSFKQPFVRSLPSNAHIDDIVCVKKQSLGLFDYLAVLFFFFKNILGEDKPSLYFRHFKDIFFVLRQERKKYKALELFINTLPSNALFYDYWYVNSTLALIWLKKKGRLQTIVCRAHAYDLYDERSFARVILFRRHIAKHLSRVFFISTYGMEYFKQRVSEKFYAKLRISYLGVETAKPLKYNAEPSGIIVVSIARLVPYKRVEKIAEVLNHFQKPVAWFHFGGGEEFNKLEIACNEIKNPLVKWKLMGQVDNNEVENFIIQNKISANITLSSSEGLPVSIMEVIRYGIPVLATDLPGMEQIITPETGILVATNESPELIARKLEILCDWDSIKRAGIVTFFEKNFMAQNNYTKFTQDLLDIHAEKDFK
jgi:colanic acid/amylovoran biosynthesis glycosyltransferase